MEGSCIAPAGSPWLPSSHPDPHRGTGLPHPEAPRPPTLWNAVFPSLLHLGLSSWPFPLPPVTAPPGLPCLCLGSATGFPHPVPMFGD
jgi:hypothetical protein